MAVLAFAGCGAGSYRYVTKSHPTLEYTVTIPNRDPVHVPVKADSIYLRLPTSWHVFTDDQFLQQILAGQPVDKQVTSARKQYVIPFDANAAPSLDNVLGRRGSRPAGLVYVTVLDDQQRDTFSIGSLRNIVINYDQDVADAQKAGSSVPDRIIAQDPNLVRSGGLHGSEIIFAVDQPDGTSEVFDQVALIDSATRVVYLLSVGCEAHCYTSYASTIRNVVRSWTVR